MSTLELEKFGVKELDPVELIAKNGGAILIPWTTIGRNVVKFVEWLGIADAAKEFAEGFKEGYDEVRK